MTADELAEQARRWAERTCQAQGIDVKVTDPATLQRVTALLGHTRKERDD